MKRIVIAAVSLLVIAGAATYWVIANFGTVIPGQVYRSAQLSGERLKDVVREYGIKSVVNLRPVRDQSDWYDEEMAAIAELGIEYRTVGQSQTTPRVDNILALRAVLDKVERPILFHCGSGVDRTGLAAVIVLLLDGGHSPEEVEREVSWRHGAIFEDSSGRVFLSQYRKWLADNGESHTPQVFDHWLKTDYTDPSGNVHFYIHEIRGQVWHRPYGLYEEGVKFNVSRTESPVLELDGWAFDTRHETVLADVSLSLGGQPLSGVEYGLHFDWLMDDFGKEEYLDSGWAVTQSLDGISDGCHDLRLTFHRLDGSSWRTPPAGRICIGP